MDLTSVRITCRFLQSKSPLSLSRVSHPTVCQQQKLLEKAKKEPDEEKGDTVVVVQIGKAEAEIQAPMKSLNLTGNHSGTSISYLP